MRTFRAWGHGPLDGSVLLDASDAADPVVTLTAPTVHAGQFAEVHVAFPADWVPGLASSGEARLDTILAQEAQWAEEANAERARARIVATVRTVILTVLPAVLLVVTGGCAGLGIQAPSPLLMRPTFAMCPPATIRPCSRR